MGEWGFLSSLFDNLQAHSPLLGRFWLFLMLVFRMLILGTVASDLFEDEQAEFACNTLQPGCKQVCYDEAFPISQYRFWVFHIVLIATPSLLFLMYAMHHHNKQKIGPCFIQVNQGYRDLRRLYLVNVAFRLMAEVGVLVGQWWLYGFRVEAQFPCSRFPCPYTVDCFTSRPAEKTVFLCFYFGVGVLSAMSSFVELIYASMKWFCPSQRHSPSEEHRCACQNLPNIKEEEDTEKGGKSPRGAASESVPGSVRQKGGSVRSGPSRKSSSIGRKSCKYPSSRMLMV